MSGLSEGALLALLSERYPAPAYAMLSNVKNGTGWTRTERFADALAMGLWPSRGLDLHGFELKANRGDWLREMRDPAKADEIARRCDRWWIVCSDGVALIDEVPQPWGLLVPREKRGKVALVAVREAEKLDAEPLTRQFLAAILRRTAEASFPRASLEQEQAKAID